MSVERPDDEEQGMAAENESNWAQGLMSSIKDGLFSWLPPLASQSPAASTTNTHTLPHTCVAPHTDTQWPDRLPRQAASTLEEGGENQGPLLLVLPGAAEECEGAVLQVAAVFRHCLRAFCVEGSHEDVEVCALALVIVGMVFVMFCT